MLLTNVLAYGHRGGELLHPRTLSSLTQSSDFILAGEKNLLQAALPSQLCRAVSNNGIEKGETVQSHKQAKSSAKPS